MQKTNIYQEITQPVFRSRLGEMSDPSEEVDANLFLFGKGVLLISILACRRISLKIPTTLILSLAEAST